MTESLTNKRLRLLIESMCADLFAVLLRPIRELPLAAHHFHRRDLTLLCFDFGDHGNVAFKTTLERPLFLRTLEALIERWQTNTVERDPHVPLLDQATLEAFAERAKALLPGSVGFSLLVGREGTSVYIANGERAGCAEVIAELLKLERTAAGGVS